jgi:hypothetical protein
MAVDSPSQNSVRRGVDRAPHGDRSQVNGSTGQRLSELLILLAALLVATAAMIGLGRWRPEGMVLEGIDTAGHWAWLRSPLIDGDLRFGNDYQGIIDPHLWPMHSEPLPETGMHPNPFPIGCAVALFPGVGLTHLALLHTPMGERWPADGFSKPYAVAAHWSLWLWAVVGLLLLHAWLRRHWPRDVALAAALLTWFATGAVHYTFPIILNNHSLSLAGMPLFLLLWDRWETRPTVGRALAAGVACGLLFLIRWQLALWPVVFWIATALRTDRRRLVPTLLLLPLPALLIAFVQLAGWRVIYGQWLLLPQGGDYVQWLRPMILPLLFSTHRGWITWTPLVVLGLIGLGFGWTANRPLVTRLAIGLACQLYISSVATDWHGAWGYSARRLTHATPLIAWGLAAALAWIAGAERRRLRWATAALSLLVIWNALFLYQHLHHLIPYHRALTWHELVGDKFHIAGSRARRFAVMNVMGFVDESRQAMRAGNQEAVSEALDLAGTWLARARDADPHHEDVYLAAATLAAERGDLEGTLWEYHSCLERIGVDRPQILTSIGACHLYAGDPTGAIAYAREALTLRPDYGHAHDLIDDARDGFRDEQHELFFF